MGEKTGLNKGAWTFEEDERLYAYMNTGEFSTWSKLPKSAGLNRCGKSCRLRWSNYLRPDLKRGAFTREEEELILNMHEKLGTSWSKMAARLPGRSDNAIKNYWHTHLKNKSTKTTKPKKAKRLPKHSRQDSVRNPFLILESSSIDGSVSLPKSQGSSPVVGNEPAIMEDHGPHETYSEADAIPWPALVEIMLKLYGENEISSKPESECEHKHYSRSVWDFPVSPQTSDDFSPPNIGDFFVENLATDEIVMLSEPIQKLDRNDQFKIDEEVVIMEYLATGETAISSELSLEPDRYYCDDQLMIDEEVPVVESMDTNQMATPSEPILEVDPDCWNEFSRLYQSLGFTSDMI